MSKPCMLAGITTTPPSFSAIMIIPTMAIADSVHVLMNYLLMMQKGETRREAMIDSIRISLGDGEWHKIELQQDRSGS